MVWACNLDRLWILLVSREYSKNQWVSCSCATVLNGASSSSCSKLVTRSTSNMHNSTSVTCSNWNISHSRRTTGIKSKTSSNMNSSWGSLTSRGSANCSTDSVTKLKRALAALMQAKTALMVLLSKSVPRLRQSKSTRGPKTSRWFCPSSLWPLREQSQLNPGLLATMRTPSLTASIGSWFRMTSITACSSPRDSQTTSPTLWIL